MCEEMCKQTSMHKACLKPDIELSRLFAPLGFITSSPGCSTESMPVSACSLELLRCPFRLQRPERLDYGEAHHWLFRFFSWRVRLQFLSVESKQTGTGTGTLLACQTLSMCSLSSLQRPEYLHEMGRTEVAAARRPPHLLPVRDHMRKPVYENAYGHRYI